MTRESELAQIIATASTFSKDPAQFEPDLAFHPQTTVSQTLCKDLLQLQLRLLAASERCTS